jgi:hypothetical protein
MNIITVILFVVALVLFVICTIGVPSPPRFNLMAAGLAFVVLAILATSVHAQERTPRDIYLERPSRDMQDEWRERRREERRMERWCEYQRQQRVMHPGYVLPRQCGRR